jgi:hypothetical protein
LAKQTLEIIERGNYLAASGSTVDVRTQVDQAVRGTVLYKAEDPLLELSSRRRRNSAWASRFAAWAAPT